MEKYIQINKDGHNIRCKLYCNKLQDIKKVVIFGHGFAGHKDNAAAAKFAIKLLSKSKNFAVLVFDWPCHGEDVKKKIILEDCDTYLKFVVEHIKDQLDTEDIYVYATSFGGYMVLKYIKQYDNPFKKIALRCPAINMYDNFIETIMQGDDYEKLQKGKSVAVGFDRKIDVNLQFLNDIKANDIREQEYFDYADDIIILHGTNDQLVPFEVVQQFADDNVIEFVPFEGADHRFQKQAHMDLATKTVMNFFEI